MFATRNVVIRSILLRHHEAIPKLIEIPIRWDSRPHFRRQEAKRRPLETNKTQKITLLLNHNLLTNYQTSSSKRRLLTITGLDHASEKSLTGKLIRLAHSVGKQEKSRVLEKVIFRVGQSKWTVEIKHQIG